MAKEGIPQMETCEESGRSGPSHLPKATKVFHLLNLRLSGPLKEPKKYPNRLSFAALFNL